MFSFHNIFLRFNFFLLVIRFLSAFRFLFPYHFFLCFLSLWFNFLSLLFVLVLVIFFSPLIFFSSQPSFIPFLVHSLNGAFFLFNLSVTSVRGQTQAQEEVGLFLPLNVTKRNILSPRRTHTARSRWLCAKGIKNRSKSASEKRYESGLRSKRQLGSGFLIVMGW